MAYQLTYNNLCHWHLFLLESVYCVNQSTLYLFMSEYYCGRQFGYSQSYRLIAVTNCCFIHGKLIINMCSCSLKNNALSKQISMKNKIL
jgi:hypothetical protein